jgi:uncharacterized damage-inducible protein DinB
MNSIAKGQFHLLDQTNNLRTELLNALSDEDLAFQLPGNPSLGELCQEMGEVEHSYTESFKTFKQDFAYKAEEPSLASSVAKLQAWFEKLDEEFKAAIATLSEEDVQGKMIDRGSFSVPPTVQFHIYREGVLIFGGKASVYVKALGKTMPEQWQSWIG